MVNREIAISNLEMNIAWIEDNELHQFPGWGNVVMAMRDAVELLKEQPEIVRCKDCQHSIFMGRRCWCEKYIPCSLVLPEWFCADGERR